MLRGAPVQLHHGRPLRVHLSPMLTLSCICTIAMPVAVFGVVSDTVDAAFIAGFFAVVNTVLNAKILRQVGTVREQVHATKRASHKATTALLEVAAEAGALRDHDRPEVERRVNGEEEEHLK